VVPVVEDDALDAISTSGRASPANTTALAVRSLGGTTSGRGPRDESGGAGGWGRSASSLGLGGRGRRGVATAANGGGSARSGGGLRVLRSGGDTSGDDITAGNDIVERGIVSVDEDTRIPVAVELSAWDTRELGGTRADDLEVEALRVALGTIIGGRAVQGNDLVAENVVTRLDVLRDLQDPAVVVVHELVGRVISGGARGDETQAINLEEPKVFLPDVLAGPVAGSEPVNDGTVVALGPGGPLEGDGVAGPDLGVALGGGTLLVADDIGGSVGAGRDETEIRLVGRPTDDRRRVAHVRVGGGVEAGVFHAVDDDVVDISVCRDNGGRREGANDRGKLCADHFRQVCRVF